MTFSKKQTDSVGVSWITNVRSKFFSFTALMWFLVFAKILSYSYEFYIVKASELLPGFSSWCYSNFSILWIVVFLMVLMCIGLFAHSEQHIKKFLAYTSVTHVGYVLAGLICSTEHSWNAALGYLYMYIVQLVAFLSILRLLQNKVNITHMNQMRLIKLYSVEYYYVVLMTLFAFSGIPCSSVYIFKYSIGSELFMCGYEMLGMCYLVSVIMMGFIYLHMILQLMGSMKFTGHTYAMGKMHNPFIDIVKPQYSFLPSGGSYAWFVLFLDVLIVCATFYCCCMLPFMVVMQEWGLMGLPGAILELIVVMLSAFKDMIIEMIFKSGGD